MSDVAKPNKTTSEFMLVIAGREGPGWMEIMQDFNRFKMRQWRSGIEVQS